MSELPPHDGVEVSPAIWNFMQADRIRSLECLTKMTWFELLRCPGVGKVTAQAVVELLAEHGLALKEPPPSRPYRWVPVRLAAQMHTGEGSPPEVSDDPAIQEAR
jgi:hypothetical protein